MDHVIRKVVIKYVCALSDENLWVSCVYVDLSSLMSVLWGCRVCTLRGDALGIYDTTELNLISNIAERNVITMEVCYEHVFESSTSYTELNDLRPHIVTELGVSGGL